MYLENKDNGFIDEFTVLNHFKDENDLSEIEISRIVEFLVKKELLIQENLSLNKSEFLTPHFMLSLEGIIFLENSTFSKISRYEKTQEIKTIAKTTLIIINAIATLCLMFWAAYNNI